MTPPLLLLVDDAPDMGDIVARLGSRAGCETTVRRDVSGGWAFLQERLPDLMLLDVNLPGVSGLELCRRARATAATARLRVALFTIWSLTDDIAAGIDAGADYVFSKDLIAQPLDWRRRLEEILFGADGRGGPPSLPCLVESTSTPPTDWRSFLTQALNHASLRWLGPEVRRALLRRVLGLTFGNVAETERNSWLLPDECALDLALAPGTVRPPVSALASTLAEQTWRLLGTEASAPFRDTLGAPVPGAAPPRSS
jgi:CheY-like chemotaxis protein